MGGHNGGVVLFATTNGKCIANQMCRDALRRGFITHVANTTVSKFADGETRIEIHENVRDVDACIIGSASAPVNDSLMEIVLMADALKRSSVASITAVIPYFGYARQDRRPDSARVPISASVVARMLEVAGVTHVITFDLHASQIQGFFSIPIDNVPVSPLFAADIRDRYQLDEIAIVTPDAGGTARARQLAKLLNTSNIALIDKRRPEAGVSEVMNVIGDVAGMQCIIIDDMIDTAGTLINAATALKDRGAASVSAYATHGLLTDPARSRIESSVLDQVVITDTVSPPPCSKVRQIQLSDYIMQVIMRAHTGLSVSEIAK